MEYDTTALLSAFGFLPLKICTESILFSKDFFTHQHLICLALAMEILWDFPHLDTMEINVDSKANFSWHCPHWTQCCVCQYHLAHTDDITLSHTEVVYTWLRHSDATANDSTTVNNRKHHLAPHCNNYNLFGSFKHRSSIIRPHMPLLCLPCLYLCCTFLANVERETLMHIS